LLEKRRKKVSKKVLRHFSLISRLQRLYAVEITAKDMRWHAEEHRDNGILRHPPIQMHGKISIRSMWSTRWRRVMSG